MQAIIEHTLNSNLHSYWPAFSVYAPLWPTLCCIPWGGHTSCVLYNTLCTSNTGLSLACLSLPRPPWPCAMPVLEEGYWPGIETTPIKRDLLSPSSLTMTLETLEVVGTWSSTRPETTSRFVKHPWGLSRISWTCMTLCIYGQAERHHVPR